MKNSMLMNEVALITSFTCFNQMWILLSQCCQTTHRYKAYWSIKVFLLTELQAVNVHYNYFSQLYSCYSSVHSFNTGSLSQLTILSVSISPPAIKTYHILKVLFTYCGKLGTDIIFLG